MQDESKLSGWRRLLGVLLLVALLLPTILWLFGLRNSPRLIDDPWLNARFPHLYPAFWGFMGLAIALKLAFWPSAKDLQRRSRWFWVLFALIACGYFFHKALGWP